MKYIVDVVKNVPDAAFFNAMKKAPADVIKTLSDDGAVSKFIIIPSSSKISIVVGIWNVLKIASCLRHNDELYIQSYGYYINLLVKLVKRKKVKVNYIVHDLTFLRFGHADAGKLEVSLLQKVDCIFVHTESMAQVLRINGIDKPLKIMHLFDYYSDDAMIPKEELLKMKNVVAFAGNLDKSLFLKPLCQSKIPCTLTYHLFGLIENPKVLSNEHIEYKGAFKPNRTGMLKAGWGLLWDGDSIDTCSGVLGQYLKINSSHKLSLYLACGMPIILWRQSSLAGWLSDKGVCVLIDSLNDIPNVLANISDEQYSRMINNAINLGNQLRHGELLKSII